MPSSTVENYLKQLYLEQQRNPNEHISTGRLAELMSVSPGSATSMIKTLQKANLVFYQSRNGTNLTESGEQLALHVLRRHRLIEQFLVKVLDFDWSEVHEEAEILEHVISEKLLQRIDDYLGNPKVDPHGDPIPSADGSLEKRDLVNLSKCEESQKIRIARILDQGADFLHYIDKQGITPGIMVSISHKDLNADAITLELTSGKSVTLGISAASKLAVEKIS
jgi:DtxR family Mn-dependent transcriptional regulator